MEAHGDGLDHAYDRVEAGAAPGDRPGDRLREAIMACRKGGIVSVLGVYGLTDKFPMGVIMNKGLTLRIGAAARAAYLPRLLEHARTGELDPVLPGDPPLLARGGPARLRAVQEQGGRLVRAVFDP